MRDLVTIRASVDAASDGPWTAYALGRGSPETVIEGGPRGEHTVAEIQPCADHPDLAAADGEFIAHARTDIPDLLDLVDSLQTELAQLRGVPELRVRR